MDQPRSPRRLIAALFFGPALLAGLAHATPIYQETFSSGSALTSDPLVNTATISSYFLNASESNGKVTTTFGPISAPSGLSSPYVLGEYTADNNTSGNNVFFASSNIAVNKGTTYTFSFALTNGDNINPAAVTLQVNGVSLLSAATALGYYNDGNPADAWQTFSATWNSGNSTSAVITLLDTQTSGNGNDFAVDNIQVYTPEPSTLALFAGPFALFLIRRRRSARLLEKTKPLAAVSPVIAAFIPDSTTAG